MSRKQIKNVNKWIELTPRFEGSLMNGYNQTDGSHIYDNYGVKYRFVALKEFNDLFSENAKLKADAIVLGNEIARQSKRAMNAKHRADCLERKINDSK